MNELQQNITTAIKGLTRRNKLKLEHLHIIETALSNDKIEPNFWFNLFENNANLALQEKIFTSEMVRLLTLRAIILAETLPEFLSWMLQRKGKDQTHYQYYYDFQDQLLNLIKKTLNQAPYFSQKIGHGVKLIIISILEKPELLISVSWLLKEKNGLWGKIYYDKIRQDIDYDLSIISQYSKQHNEQYLKLKNDQNWRKLWQEIAYYWQPNANLNFNPKYQYLAQLFETLEDYQISAFFYHIGVGKVSQNVFGQLTQYSFCSALSTNIYNLTIYRQLNIIEVIILPIINVFITLKLDIFVNFIIKKIISFYYYCKPNISIFFWNIKYFFQEHYLIKDFLISLLYLLMWCFIYGLFVAISEATNSEIFMIIPVIMNLPLAFIFGIFIGLFQHWIGIIIAHFGYFFYRFVWFKDKPYLTFWEKLGLRIREFFVWLIVIIILGAVMNIIFYLLSY